MVTEFCRRAAPDPEAPRIGAVGTYLKGYGQIVPAVVAGYSYDKRLILYADHVGPDDNPATIFYVHTFRSCFKEGATA